MFDQLHQLELPMIHWVHTFRTPLLDDFFCLLNLIDTSYFLFLILPAIWFGVDWRSGVRVYSVLLLSGLFNYALKAYFHEPRPFLMEPGLNLVHVGGKYGFPSGAAQSAVIYAALLIGTFRKTWAYFLAAFVLIALSFSRVYLGVHFPSDVVGGLVIGALLVLVYYTLFPKIEQALEKMPLSYRFGLSQILPLIGFCIAFAYGYKTPMLITLSFLFVGWGLCLSAWQHTFLPPSTSFKQGFLRAAVGTAGFFAFALSLPLYMQPLFTGLWLSYFGGRVIAFCEGRCCVKFPR